MSKEHVYKSDSRSQQEIFVSGDRFTLPYSLKDDQEFNPIVSYLNEEDRWQGHFLEKSKTVQSRCLAVNLKRKLTFEFEPLSWQADRISSLGELDVPEQLSGLFIISDCDQLNRIASVIEDSSPSLIAESPVFVFEKKDLNYRQGLDERVEILGRAGLVEKKILIRASSKESSINENLVWRARASKEPGKRAAINYLEGGPAWRKPWLLRLLKEEKSKYQQIGFTVLNSDEILERLKSTTFPLDDLGRLKLGFGFRLQALCGCEWQVTLNGDWVRDLDCGDPECNGIPVK